MQRVERKSMGYIPPFHNEGQLFNDQSKVYIGQYLRYKTLKFVIAVGLLWGISPPPISDSSLVGN